MLELYYYVECVNDSNVKRSEQLSWKDAIQKTILLSFLSVFGRSGGNGRIGGNGLTGGNGGARKRIFNTLDLPHLGEESTVA